MIKNDVSFIIPALNEEAHIGGVLDSIRENADELCQYEVIVVDNGSVDRTVEIAEQKGAICLHAPGCSISSLRNLGASRASSYIFIFLDGDVYLGDGWGERIGDVLVKVLKHPHIITGSLYGISDENNWIERIWFAPRTTLKEVNYINGGHLIIHRDLFSKVGGFDPELQTGEDYEFCARARRMGARIENDPDLKVVHAGYPKNIKHFFVRERWHGRGDFNSLKTLVSSKPAMASLANLLALVTSSFGMVIYARLWFIFPCVYVLFLAGLAIAASINRCRGKFNSDFMGIVFLYMIYFSARTVSLVDAAIQFPMIIRRYSRV